MAGEESAGTRYERTPGTAEVLVAGTPRWRRGLSQGGLPCIREVWKENGELRARLETDYDRGTWHRIGADGTVGPATLEQLRPWVYVDGTDGIVANVELLTRSAPPVPVAPSGAKKITDLKEPIHLNHASVEELQRLPGIGPKLSQRIVEERQKGPFKSVDDLRRAVEATD